MSGSKSDLYTQCDTVGENKFSNLEISSGLRRGAHVHFPSQNFFSVSTIRFLVLWEVGFDGDLLFRSLTLYRLYSWEPLYLFPSTTRKCFSDDCRGRHWFTHIPSCVADCLPLLSFCPHSQVTQTFSVDPIFLPHLSFPLTLQNPEVLTTWEPLVTEV